jgi:hypothetical protein
MATMTQMQSSQVWTAKYSPPQYGRKRWVFDRQLVRGIIGTCLQPVLLTHSNRALKLGPCGLERSRADLCCMT